MWLLIDIGNTALKGTLYDPASDTLQSETCLKLPSHMTVADFKSALKDAGLKNAGFNNTNPSKITRVGIASVVPEMTGVVNKAIKSQWNIKPKVVTHRLKLPFKMAYKTPETLGADRLAAAVAGYDHFNQEDSPRPIIVICAGTATTFEILSEGIYQGGIIAPGPILMQNSLWNGTAQLPAIQLFFPDSIVGTDTKSAIRSGIMFGYLGQVEGILKQLSQQYPDPIIVATGGWSNFLNDHLQIIDQQVDNFVLAGVLALLKQNP